MTDSYGRSITYLRISLTELCNLRCRYCMPADGVCKRSHTDMLREEELIAAVETAAALGIRKIRLTGGEPLVKKNILSICERISSIDGIEELCLTTNGTLLPALAQPLRSAGVRRLNISLDTLDAGKFRAITRVGSLQDTLDGIDAALCAGYDRIKLNTVLVGGFNDDEIRALSELTLVLPVDVRFIELMPMVDSAFPEEAFIPCTTVLDVLPELEPVPADGGVARLYRLPGSQGHIGLISPVSAHFCAGCNRIRLTADGTIKPCLHSNDEFSIKGMTKEQMSEEFRRAILSKPEWHGTLDARNQSRSGRNMNEIGG